MKVLVIGGGYLGSMVCTKLIERGHYVRCMDNLTYGKDSLKHLLANGKFELCIGDKRNLIDLEKNITDCEACIDVSGIVGEPASALNPKKTYLNDVIAVEAMAKLCELHDIPLIFASSCSVYGSQPNKMITEKSKTNPLGYYAKFKLECEKSILAANTAPCILRFGTLFGKSYRQRFDLVVNKFISEALTGQTITIEGGEQVRPFLHVMDAAESIIFSLEKELDGTFNVISENQSIKDVGYLIGSLSETEVTIDPTVKDERNYKVSMGKIYDHGFETQYGIKFAFNELAKLFDNEHIETNDPKYSNIETLKNMA